MNDLFDSPVSVTYRIGLDLGESKGLFRGMNEFGSSSQANLKF